MASPIATALHDGPVDQPGEQAYLYARSGIARSATTRSNYVAVQVGIDWIVRDTAGNIISTTDLSGSVLMHTLHVSQAINDEPDTCSFTLRPQDPPAAIPQVGQEIRITWAPGGPPIFHGYIVTAQRDWRLANLQPPWVAIHCQDPMWRFDARLVNYRFPAQSVTASIAFLVKWFCNTSILDTFGVPVPSAFDFHTTFVEAGMPSLPAFDVVNQRPSTVMRTLLAAVNGGFYLEGFEVHAWANSLSEPRQSNPVPLTVGLKTLHTFRHTTDATQVRRRVLVEGRRTAITMALPAVADQSPAILGVPVQDATMFPTGLPDGVSTLARLGTQWVRIQDPNSVTANGANPPQTKTQAAFTVGQLGMSLTAMPITPPATGWIRIGNQYAYYKAWQGTHTADGWQIFFFTPADVGGPLPYGVFTVPIAAGEIVEWVDAVTNLQPHGLTWPLQFPNPAPGDVTIRAHVTETPMVTIAVAATAHDQWPPLEGFVQDGRYSYAGAQARADADLAAFKDPLITVEWDTDDLNAIPGRAQAMALASDTIDPAITTTVTILRVDLSFPLRTLPPRRSCAGGTVKPSSFMDLVVTTQN